MWKLNAKRQNWKLNSALSDSLNAKNFPCSDIYKFPFIEQGQVFKIVAEGNFLQNFSILCGKCVIFYIWGVDRLMKIVYIKHAHFAKHLTK